MDWGTNCDQFYSPLKEVDYAPFLNWPNCPLSVINFTIGFLFAGVFVDQNVKL